MTKRLIVERSAQGERLDVFLTGALDDLSRSAIQRHIQQGAVLLNDEIPPKGAKTKLCGGDVLEYTEPDPEPMHLEHEDIPIDVLHEDSDIVVVNKPAGLVVHPAPGHRSGTLLNALLHHFEGFDSDQNPRPGIVHRLDRGTTGVMVVAKNPRTHQGLVEAFAARRVEKRYIAVARDVLTPPVGRFETFYGRHPRDRKRFSSKVPAGKTAVTHYRVVETFVGASWVEVDLETGRTHQIRVHFADQGHPLLGDDMYGGGRTPKDPRLRPILAGLERPSLHAWHLAFAHPTTGADLEFSAPIPQDLTRLRDDLRAIKPTA